MAWADEPGLARFLRRVKISRSSSARDASGLIGGVVAPTLNQPKSTSVAQMRLLAESLSVGPLVFPALIIAYSITLTPFVPWTYVSIWTMAMLALQFINLRLSRSFLSLDAEEVIVDYWAPRFKANALAFSITLTSILFVFWSPDNILHQNYLISTVAISFAPMMLVTVCYLPVAHRTIFPMLAGLTLRFVSLGDIRHIMIVVVLVIFGILLHQLAATINGAMSRSINLQSDKNALIEQLFRAKRESDAARARAEEANRAKSHFLANMSHELRTPLNAIIGFSEVMMREIFGQHTKPIYKEYSNDINGSGQHLLGLINDILDLSRIEAGRFEISEEEIDLEQVAEEARHLLDIRAKAQGVDVIYDFEDSLPLLYADARAMRQIWINLLTNAIKFSPKGSTITLVAEREANGDLRFGVHDQGSGISESEIDRVTEVFTQGAAGIAQPGKGSGLGLSIVKGLLHIHNGRFEIRSKLGEGTQAEAVFPASRLIGDHLISAVG